MWKWLLATLALLVLVASAAYGYYIRSYTTAEPPVGALKQAVLDIDGIRRDYSYYLAPELQDKPALVFVLHGSRSNREQIRWQTAYGFDHLAGPENFIPVYPNGFENHWNDCRGSASYSANTLDINDLQFFKAMIDEFEDRFDIDRRKVYATGFSNGGHMAFKLALEMPDQIAAIAPIAANLPVDSNLDCRKSGQPVSVALFNGTRDPINPYDGGLVELFGDRSRGEVLSSDDTIAYWRALAGLGQDPYRHWQVAPIVVGGAEAEVTEWRGGATQIRRYKLIGSGHVIPSAKVHFGALFGGNMPAVEGAREIWDFFVNTQQWAEPDASIDSGPPR